MDGLSFMSKMTYMYDRQFQERQLKILRKRLRRDSNNVYATHLCEKMKNAFGLRTLPVSSQVLPLIHFTQDETTETSTHFTLIYTSSSLNPLQSICDHYFGSRIIQLQREVYQLISANNLNESEDEEDDDENLVHVNDEHFNNHTNHTGDEEAGDVDSLSDSEVRGSVSESDPNEDNDDGDEDDDDMIDEINSNIYKLQYSRVSQEKEITEAGGAGGSESVGERKVTDGINCSSGHSCESASEENQVLELMKKTCLSNGNSSSTSTSNNLLTNNPLVPYLSGMSEKVPAEFLQLYMNHTLSNSVNNSLNKKSSSYTVNTNDGNICNQQKRGPGRPRKHPNSLDKKYVCERCNKSFNVRSHLESHMVTHTGEKKYICSTCGNKFTQSSSLRNHVIALHTRNFPHVCNICGKGFLLPSQLKKHKGLVHPDRLRTSHRPVTQ